MSLRRRLAVWSMLAACTAVVGCTSLNPRDFFKLTREESVQYLGEEAPDESRRVAVLGLDDDVQPTEALKGIAFFLPDARPLTEWTLPGGSPEQSVEHVEAAPNFQIAWKRGFGAGSARRRHVTAPPISADGRIFVMDGEAAVSAIDGVTGRTVWRVDLNPRIRRDRHAFGGGLAFADGKLYVASGFRFVAAVDPANGKILWKTTTSAPIHSAPTVAGGRVFTISTDNQLESFDATTGRAGWTYQALVEPARILAATSPAVSGDTVLAAFASGELVALRAANGNELWSQQLTRASRNTALSEIRDIPGRPVVYRGAVIAGSHSGIVASVDIRSGEYTWQPLPIVSMATPWPAGDVIFVMSKAGQVYCLSRETGQVYWVRNLNEGLRLTRKNFLGFQKLERPLWTGPMLASGRLITVSSDGRAMALNPRTGEPLATLDIGASALIAPIAVNGTIYVVTDDAELVAIR